VRDVDVVLLVKGEQCAFIVENCLR